MPKQKADPKVGFLLERPELLLGFHASHASLLGRGSSSRGGGRGGSLVSRSGRGSSSRSGSRGSRSGSGFFFLAAGGNGQGEEGSSEDGVLH